MGEKDLDIGIVGPCAAGKSTLVEGLNTNGYRARQIAQEHSYVPQMWRVIRPPDILIYLDAPYEICTERKQLNWSQAEYGDQVQRLNHAMKNCDLYLDTSELSIEQVLKRTIDWLTGSTPLSSFAE
jgi:cytidylate kinase